MHMSLLLAVAVFGVILSAQNSMAAGTAKPTVMKPTSILLFNFQDEQEIQRICAVLKEGISDWSISTQPISRCMVIRGSDSLIAWKNTVATSTAGTAVIVENNPKLNTYDLEIRNLVPEDETDPRQLRWNVHKGSELPMITKLLRQYNSFDVNKAEIKKSLLAQALAAENIAAPRFHSDEDFKYAYERYLNDNQQSKKYLAAGLEIAAILGASTAQYYYPPEDINPNKADWEYNRSSAIKARLNGSALRYDDNGFRTNRGHYFAGTVYYTVARNSGLNRWESLLVTFTASSFWEYVSEYREVVSLNDQVNTTLGGFIMGETIFQMGKIFQSRPNTGANRVMRGVFGSPQKMSGWIEKNANGKHFIPDNLDTRPDVWSKLDLSLGTQQTKQGAKSMVVGVDGEVVAIPMFEQPGRARALLTDTVFSKFIMEKSLGGTDDTFKIFAKSTLAAYYEKNLGVSSNNQLDGYNIFVGPSSALEIDQEIQFENKQSKGSDFRGVVHVVGGTLDATIYHNGWKIRATIDVYADFAMIRSYAFESYRQNHDVSKVSAVLRDKDYYYGTGGTGSVALSAENDQVGIGISASQSGANGIQSRTRFDTERDPDKMNDQVLTTKGWVVYQLTKSMKLEVGVEHKKRSGSIGGLPAVTGSEVKKYGKLIYVY